MAGRWVSDEMMVFEMPIMKPGRDELRLTTNIVDLINTSLSFHVYPLMTALFATPSFGETGGGTTVDMYETNFRLEANLSFSFNTISANALYFGPNTLKCFTPPLEVAKLVDFEILSDIGKVAFVEIDFEFYSPFYSSFIKPATFLVWWNSGNNFRFFSNGGPCLL